MYKNIGEATGFQSLIGILQIVTKELIGDFLILEFQSLIGILQMMTSQEKNSPPQ